MLKYAISFLIVSAVLVGCSKRPLTQLPASHSALGRVVTLESVSRTSNGAVKIKYILKRPSGSIARRTNVRVELPAYVDYQQVMSSARMTEDGEIRESYFRIPGSIKSMTVPVRLSADDLFRLRFADISAKSLPVTQSVGGLCVTVRKSTIQKPAPQAPASVRPEFVVEVETKPACSVETATVTVEGGSSIRYSSVGTDYAQSPAVSTFYFSPFDDKRTGKIRLDLVLKRETLAWVKFENVPITPHR